MKARAYLQVLNFRGGTHRHKAQPEEDGGGEEGKGPGSSLTEIGTSGTRTAEYLIINITQRTTSSLLRRTEYT